MNIKQKIKKFKEEAGVVVSNKMTKTAVVSVSRHSVHPVYGKIIKRLSKYQVDLDLGVVCNVGDSVVIRQVRPVSKTKSWKIVRVLTTNKVL